MKRLLIVLTSAFALTIGWVAAASADPAVQHHEYTCDDGSSFTAEFVNPPQAGGIPSTYSVVSGSGTGAAADAGGFNFHELLITDENGTPVVQSGDAERNVGRHHQLVTCNAPSVSRPGYTVYLTGFFIPAR